MQNSLLVLATLAALGPVLPAQAVDVSTGSIDVTLFQHTYQSTAPARTIDDFFSFDLTGRADVTLLVQSCSDYGCGNYMLDAANLTLDLRDANNTFLAAATASPGGLASRLLATLDPGHYVAEVRGDVVYATALYRATFSALPAAPVPEPATWLMFIAGAALVRARVRRRVQ